MLHGSVICADLFSKQEDGYSLILAVGLISSEVFISIPKSKHINVKGNFMESN